MKLRGFVAAGLATALLGAAGCGGGGTDSSEGAPDTLTVWLMVDAENGWQSVVKAANKEFEEQHPKTNVEVRYQAWEQYLTKFEAQLGAGNPPDVLEMGNTQTAKYMANGALLNISDAKDSFANSDSWLKGLEKSCTFEGKLYCVPYYAATRTVVYRKDMFAEAGINNAPPQSLSELGKMAQKLEQQYAGGSGTFSAFYFPGRYWYLALSFVYDYGGQIAKKVDGKWEVTLDEPAARKGLKKAKEFMASYSNASKTSDSVEQAQVFADGGVAMFYGLGWEIAVATSKENGNPELKGKLGQFAMPSHKKGETMPAFLGGSDLAIPASTDAPKLAKDWIRIYTSQKSMKKLVKKGGVIPNNESMLDLVPNEAMAKAAANNWFVPVSPNWASVEQRQILENMLVDIFTGKSSVKEATAAASRRIEKILNGG